jgi:Fur family transcriptional regulator, iron response regulator
MATALAEILRSHGIQPSAQRLAVAEYVLRTKDHPSADEVLTRVRGRVPMISRATVYNTLRTFVEKGLLRQFVLGEGRLVFDPHLAPHHHFLDEGSGTIHDVPWEALEVRKVEKLQGLEVREYQVVLRGHRAARRPT